MTNSDIVGLPKPLGIEEVVARAIAADLYWQDDWGPQDWKPADDWDFTWPYIDQGEVDFRQIARAAIEAYEQAALSGSPEG